MFDLKFNEKTKNPITCKVMRQFNTDLEPRDDNDI